MTPPPFDLDVRDVPPRAMTHRDLRAALSVVDAVLERGAATHGDAAWRTLLPDVHVDHAARHLARWREGRALLDLAHAFTRLGFAVELLANAEADR